MIVTLSATCLVLDNMVRAFDPSTPGGGMSESGSDLGSDPVDADALGETENSG